MSGQRQDFRVGAADVAQEIWEALAGARLDLQMIADCTPHKRGCDEPDDCSCAACIAKSALARLDEFDPALTTPTEHASNAPPVVRFLDPYGNVIAEREAVASKVGWGADVPKGAQFVGVSAPEQTP